jgi:hypothetical protein
VEWLDVQDNKANPKNSVKVSIKENGLTILSCLSILDMSVGKIGIYVQDIH